MLGKIKDVESSLIFVNFMTGLTALLLGIALFVILRIDVIDGRLILNEFKISSVEIVLVMLFVFIGFFIYGIRYLGFEWYRVKLYPKVKIRQEKINKRRERKGKTIRPNPNKEEGHNPLSWFIKYAFRNGTTVEESILAKKKGERGDKSIFDWIVTSKNYATVSFDMWRYANFINNRHPEANIYRFYYHSEIFQCLDTLFLLMSFVPVFPLFYLIIYGNSSDFMRIICLLCYSLLMFIFHRISKGTGKACIRRFFLEIAVGLTDCKDISLPNQNVDTK